MLAVSLGMNRKAGTLLHFASLIHLFIMTVIGGIVRESVSVKPDIRDLLTLVFVEGLLAAILAMLYYKAYNQRQKK